MEISVVPLAWAETIFTPRGDSTLMSINTQAVKLIGTGEEKS